MMEHANTRFSAAVAPRLNTSVPWPSLDQNKNSSLCKGALWHCATIWKVVGTRPNEVNEFFQFTLSFQLH
jgi:hypothetical protein